jgi:hypothetical protein
MSTDGKDGGGPGGHVQFIERHVPGLLHGTYHLTIKQELEIKPDPIQEFTRTCTFVVDGHRSVLQPADIAAVFPPDGSVGDYDAVVPHIVLNRSTLPWERTACPDRDGGPYPWLALLLFDEGEKPTPISIDLADHRPSPGETQAPATAIDVPLTLLKQLLPAHVDDLKLLAHVRQVLDEHGRPQGDEVAVVLGNRLPAEGGMSTVHVVIISNLYDASGNLAAPAGGRLVSLKSWSFGCAREPGGLVALLTALDRTPPTLQLPPVNLPDADRQLAVGLAPLPHDLRDGGQTVSWYRGPLAPAGSNDSFTEPVRAADALLRYDPATGLFDVSYAAAWELGRLLVLRSKAISKSLFLWKRACAHQIRRKEASNGINLPLRDPAPVSATPPTDVVRWFAGLRRLEDVPFNYLVPDERMLPPESIRFFCIDRLWIAALLDGAASLARVSEADVKRDRDLLKDLAAPPPGPWSGILMRSSVVAAWPGLLVDAADASRQACPPVRIERLSPNILLAIFEKQLDSVSLHLQPELLHFGFDQRGAPNPGFYKVLRRDDGTEDEKVSVNKIDWRQPPDAPTAPRVFSASGMAEEMRKAFKDKAGDPFRGSGPNSAQFAFQMIEAGPRVTFWRGNVPPAT